MKYKTSLEKRKKARVAVAHGIGSRSEQQDCYAFDGDDCGENGFFAVVADGMGGLVNSDQISTGIVYTMADAYAPGGELSGKDQLLMLLQQAVRKAAGLTEDVTYKSGSTVAACILKNGGLSWISVGDSRVYLWRCGGLIQLSRDHDFEHDLDVMTVMDQMTLDEAASNPRKDALTSFIGSDFPRFIDFNPEPVHLLKGDRIILMSDGVYKGLSEKELCTILSKPAVKAAAKIEETINLKNSPNQDNYTAVILEVQ